VWAVTLVLFVITSAGGWFLWQAKSFQLLSVQTASMAPLLKSGDAVVVKPVPEKSLKVGDIITYRDPNHARVTITHRVISVDKSKHLLITKGDNAPIADPPFDLSLVIGRVSYGLPKLGYVLDFFRSRAGLVSLIYIPAAGIIWNELRRLHQSYQHPTYRLFYSK